MIGKDGEQLGILDIRKAQQIAESLNLDLVEVAGKADPPVCKIMDYGKFKFQEKKKLQQARKNQVHVEIKEIQIRPKTEGHDLAHKAKSALAFLEDGDKVKITVFFRGREMEHLETGWATLLEFIKRLEDQAIIEARPKMEGKRLALMLGPLPPGKKPPAGHLVQFIQAATPRPKGETFPGVALAAAAAAAAAKSEGNTDTP